MDYSIYFQHNISVKSLKSISDPMQFFTEKFLLKDLGRNAVSNLTKYHKGERLTNPEYESGMNIIEAQWSPSNNTYTVFFEMTPTKGSPTTVLTPKATEYSGSFYNVVFQFLNPNGVFGTQEEFSARNSIDQTALIKTVIQTNEAKLHSNDPSFYYQGMWEDLANLDGTIFAFPGPRGDGVWRQKHSQSGGLSVPSIRITKHMAQIIDNINNLASAIRDKTRVIA